MLEVRQLAKSFGTRVAVDGVGFTAAPGQVLGLLGPNGAGKSTIVNIVAGVLAPDAGGAFIHGEPVGADGSATKQLVGFVPQDLALYDELSALDNLRLFGSLYGLAGSTLEERASEALAVARLAERGRDRVGSFSGGMKRRLNIAAGLLHRPQLLLLDEPTVGVDPQSRNAIFEALRELKARGLTLVYTTHYMEEAERLCDRIVVIDHGRVLADDTLDGLLALLPAEHAAAVVPQPPRATLEAVFLELTGRSLRDA